MNQDSDSVGVKHKKGEMLKFFKVRKILGSSQVKRWNLNCLKNNNLFLFSQAHSQKTDPGWTFTVLFKNKKFTYKTFVIILCHFYGLEIQVLKFADKKITKNIFQKRVLLLNNFFIV